MDDKKSEPEIKDTPNVVKAIDNLVDAAFGALGDSVKSVVRAGVRSAAGGTKKMLDSAEHKVGATAKKKGLKTSAKAPAKKSPKKSSKKKSSKKYAVAKSTKKAKKTAPKPSKRALKNAVRTAAKKQSKKKTKQKTKQKKTKP